jgi:hypothetical protein
MPSDKAKANKALTATCVACNKPVSTESAVPLTCRLPAGSPSDRLTPRSINSSLSRTPEFQSK